MTFHSFHLVERSPWPLIRALRAFMLTSSLIILMHINMTIILLISIIFIFLIIFQWWRDITREATIQGYHTFLVKNGIKWGITLFIIREVLFFFRFFWTFFHASLSPDLELGNSWPPCRVQPFNPYLIPLLNTTILLSSGVTVTWTHHSILKKKYSNAIIRLLLTIILGVYFSYLQILEYLEASFSISDSIYGATFFVATGFHGLHVLIGSIFLIINIIRIYLGHIRKTHHFSFEAAAWYWHFVDVVWLFLFTFIYWRTF